MSIFGRSAEEIIRAAMEAGEFDDLAGKGKPLPLEDNPFEPPEMRMAYQLLRQNGFTLDWIEQGKEIDAELEAARRALKAAYTNSVDEKHRELANSRFAAAIAILNRRIFEYNLRVPSANFQRQVLNAQAEMRSALE